MGETNYVSILEIEELKSKPDKVEKRISESKDQSKEITMNTTQKHTEMENTKGLGESESQRMRREHGMLRNKTKTTAFFQQELQKQHGEKQFLKQ